MQVCRRRFAAAASAVLWLLPLAAGAQAATALPNNDGADGVLRVCADPNNMPLSNSKGEGYENRIASEMAHDFGWRLEYTFFPQRMGFVRHTLREKVPQTEQYKCDLVVGVPKGYELTSTTQPYLHSTYAIVFRKQSGLGNIHTPDDLLKLPPAQLHALRFGIFSQTPAVDWLLRNGLIDQAVSYQVQSGDPQAFPGEMVERDLAAGKVDVVFVWGPIAGYFAKRGGSDFVLVPFPRDPRIKFDYEISMGVRYGEKPWRDKVDHWISENRQKIDQILTSYDVPLVNDEGVVIDKTGDRKPAGSP